MSLHKFPTTSVHTLELFQACVQYADASIGCYELRLSHVAKRMERCRKRIRRLLVDLHDRNTDGSLLDFRRNRLADK